jgi:hypothetical protein
VATDGDPLDCVALQFDAFPIHGGACLPVLFFLLDLWTLFILILLVLTNLFYSPTELLMMFLRDIVKAFPYGTSCSIMSKPESRNKLIFLNSPSVEVHPLLTLLILTRLTLISLFESEFEEVSQDVPLNPKESLNHFSKNKEILWLTSAKDCNFFARIPTKLKRFVFRKHLLLFAKS